MTTATKQPADDGGKRAIIMPNKNSLDAAEGHPSADKTSRHEMDQALRAHGFMIWSRAKGQEPRWTTPYFWRKEKSWSESEAIHMMIEKELPQAETTKKV